ncbi:thiol-disulfide oxidoreductase DCC family protein [Streptomyces ipomoeae]|uniref:thiol-disulfide oxidoreductase DCC family protein n=1 Tax=Streptomyces ipomoeae TaxID=103232 RepID=UPI001FD581C3|nr:DCC1-like thiol-disulfide oxidoreductase family protein [Streptomyces ipomoeae]MDX2939119.1 DCC1-like thiol-disulfide oxidoreductase family protein [Streptomyces ipomoeae]
MLFDDDCGFCHRSVRWLEQRGALKATAAVPWQSLNRDRLPVPPTRLDQEVILVRGTSILGGAAALAEAMAGASLPWRLTSVFLRAPGIRTAAAYVYRRVAANRHRMPGGTAACQVRPRNGDRSDTGRSA